MAKDRKKLQHIHSSIPGKQPTPSTLEVGEIAVNNANGQEFLSLKNSNDKVVRFSSDDQIITWTELKEVMPYSGTVDNVHLDTNRSNIEIKLNQVAAGNTAKHDIVNGAKDIDGELVNPTTDGGITDGAGFAIDMSLYAMQGANPSFSSITTDCHATFNGTTEVIGSDGDCGSKFVVNVNETDIDSDTVDISANTTSIKSCGNVDVITNDLNISECEDGGTVTIDTTDVKVSADTTDIKSCNKIDVSTNDLNISECEDGGTVTIDTTDINVSAETTDIKSCDGINVETSNLVIAECDGTDGNVTINTTNTNINSCDGIDATTDSLSIAECTEGSGTVVVNTTNVSISADTTNIESCGKLVFKSDDIEFTQCDNGTVTFDADNLCLRANDKINVYGDETNVGIDCDDSKIASNTRIFGNGTLITTNSAATEYAESGNIEMFADDAVLCTANHVSFDVSGDTDGVFSVFAKNRVSIQTGEPYPDGIKTSIVSSDEGDINERAIGDICVNADNNATFYGVEGTYIGTNCDGTATAATTTVKGQVTAVHASNGNLGLTSKEDILASSEGDIIATAESGLCMTAGDSATLYGLDKTDIGVDCQGSQISDTSSIYGENIYILTEKTATQNTTGIGLNANGIHENGRTITEVTNNLTVEELTEGQGSVNVNTTDVVINDKRTGVHSCDAVEVVTNDFVLSQCDENSGSVRVSVDEVEINANETEINSCDVINENTDALVVTECNEGSGSVVFDTTRVIVTSDTTTISSCKGINENTDSLVIDECNEGSGSVVVNTTDIAVSADTTSIESCGKLKFKSNDIEFDQCDGSGKTTIKACSGITLESDNLVLKGCTDEGKITISTNDLCLVGEEKVNVYGSETNIGLDCVCEEGEQNIADKTRVFGKGVLITNKDVCSAATEDDFVIIEATDTIAENADYVNINAAVDFEANAGNPSTSGAQITFNSNGNMSIHATSNICEDALIAATFFGSASTNVGINCNNTAISEETTIKGGKTVIDATTSNLGLTAKEDILESAEGDIFVTANSGLCLQAGDAASLYGQETTRVGKSCDGKNMTNNLEIGGQAVCVEADDKASLFGYVESDLGVSCDGRSISELTVIKGDDIRAYAGDEVAIVGDYSYFGYDGDDLLSKNTYIEAEEMVNIMSEQGNINVTAQEDINVHSDEDYCLSARNVNIGGTETIVIGKTCNGEFAEDIEYYRTPESQGSAVSSTTVDNALDEVLNRSKVTITQTPNPSGNSGETLITYTVWQDGHDIGEINLPKDHLIKDTGVVWGTYDESTGVFTSGDTGCDDCEWYIEMEWFVSGDTGHSDKKTYVPANSLVKDTAADNTDANRGVNVNVWYDGKQNLVSADTTIEFSTNSTATSGHSYQKSNGVHKITGATLTFAEGPFSGETYNPYGINKEVKIPGSMTSLTEYNGSCFILNNDICMSGNTIAAKAFYAKSDRNLKENIEPLMHFDYGKADNVSFASFNFKNDSDKRKTYGVIAQDVLAAGLDELVHSDESGSLSVDYTSLLILKIASLENEIKKLSEEIKNLKNKE